MPSGPRHGLWFHSWLQLKTKSESKEAKTPVEASGMGQGRRNQEEIKFMWGMAENSQIDELFNKDNANYQSKPLLRQTNCWGKILWPIRFLALPSYVQPNFKTGIYFHL